MARDNNLLCVEYFCWFMFLTEVLKQPQMFSAVCLRTG